MNRLKKQILLLDADILITETDKKRVDAFQRIESPAMMIKRTIERIIKNVHFAYPREYSEVAEYTLDAVGYLEKYVAELKKRCNEFKRIK